MTMGPPLPPYDPFVDACRYSILLWTHIMDKMKGSASKHHVTHEPGGGDAVLIPVGGLRNVTITNPVAGQGLVVGTVVAGSANWVNGAVAGGSGKHGAYLYVPLPTSIGVVSPPGPKNISGDDYTITAVTVKTDGQVGGSMNGGSFSFGAGGGEDDTTGLTTTWTAGDRLTVTIASGGADGTYLIFDWAIT